MRWQAKAAVQRACARLPGGSHAYVKLQRTLGGLDSSPERLASRFADLVRLIDEAGGTLQGARCVEIGTGQVPLIPVLLYLAGADEVITVDLYRCAIFSLLTRAVSTLRERPDVLLNECAGLVDEAALCSRLDRLTAAKYPADLLARANVQYLAPADAGSLPLPAGSIDVHLSADTLEHVRPGDLTALLAEGRRLLRPQGIAVHLVDPSDHYAHHDRDITSINFLRFSEEIWTGLADNQFAYHNRLRSPQILRTFQGAELCVEILHLTIDESAMRALSRGFPIDAAFVNFTPEELCTSRLGVLARPASPGSTFLPA